MNQIKELLLQLIGNKNTLSTNTLFIDFTGSHEKAIFLSQLFYWSGRATMKDGFVAKTYEEWHKEIRIKEHSLRRYTKEFKKKGLLETKFKKFNEVPTLHYKLDLDKTIKELFAFCEANKLLASQEVTLDPNKLSPSKEASIKSPSTNRDYHKLPSEITRERAREEKQKVSPKNKKTKSDETAAPDQPRTEAEVREAISRTSINGDNLKSRRIIWGIVSGYLKTDDFKSNWEYLAHRFPAGIDPEQVINDWVDTGPYYDVKEFKLHKIKGWIRTAANGKNGKANGQGKATPAKSVRGILRERGILPDGEAQRV